MSLSKRISKTFLKKKRSKDVKSRDILEITKNNVVMKIKLGPWDDNENDKLREWIEQHGPTNWTKCAEFMKNRTAKQCREHWNNSLDSSLKKGNWTSEEDLLIMKFYKKYKSWRKMIPMFKNRTENSIKNRFFSQLRKIIIKKEDTGKKQYGTKFGLQSLLAYLDEGIKEAEQRYYSEHKNMTKEAFENYMKQIEATIKRKRSGKFINLDNLKEKHYSKRKSNNNIININEEKEKEYDNESEENLDLIIKNRQKEDKKNQKFTISRATKNEELYTRDTTVKPESTVVQFLRSRSKFFRSNSNFYDMFRDNNMEKNPKDDNNFNIPLKEPIQNNENITSSKKQYEPAFKGFSDFSAFKLSRPMPDYQRKDSKIVAAFDNNEENEIDKQVKAINFYENIPTSKGIEIIKQGTSNTNLLGSFFRSSEKKLFSDFKFV